MSYQVSLDDKRPAMLLPAKATRISLSSAFPAASSSLAISERASAPIILAELLRDGKQYVERLVPYSEAGSIAKIREQGELISEEYREDGIFIKAYL